MMCRANNTLFKWLSSCKSGVEIGYHGSKVSCHERIIVIGFACFHEPTFNPFSSISSGFARCVSYLLSKSEHEGDVNIISGMIEEPPLFSKLTHIGFQFSTIKCQIMTMQNQNVLISTAEAMKMNEDTT